ncbi:MAG: hypothetical protein K0R08_1727, partial [Solimicrobium sp.]|nr:hypothetical protein [Solimicrobium sp.]
GELTIEQAKDETTEEKIAQFLEGIKEQLGEMARHYSRFDADRDWSQQNCNPIAKYMIDGSLNLDLLEEVDSGYFLIFSSDPAGQKYLDNGKIKIEDFGCGYGDCTDTIEELLSALNNNTVQTYIDNEKLTPHRSGHTEGWNFIRFYYALSSPGLQKYLQNGQVTLERIIQVVNFLKYHHYTFLRLIDNSSIQRWIDSNQLTVEQFIDLCVKKHEFNEEMFEYLPDHLDVRYCKGVTKYLENGKLTVKSFINEPDLYTLTQVLDMKGIQEQLDNDTLTIKQFAHLPDAIEFAEALDNPNVRELLSEMIVTINQLTNVVNISDFVKVISADVMRHLRGDERCFFIQSLMNLPDISAFKNVISHRHVSHAVMYHEVSCLELIKMPSITELSHALRNKNVYKFLVNRELTIKQLIKFPNISEFVNAVNHQQIRAKLKQGKLTLEQLIDSPNITELVNGLLAESSEH